jgi:interleukin-1 receptor-associated kinase 1
MYVGFSAATGQFGCVESHTVTSWNFSSTGLPASAAADSKLAAPIFNNTPEVRIFTFAVVAGLGLLLVTFLFVFDNLRRRKNNKFGADSVQYDQLLDGQPRRFTFKELNIATKGFNPSELLGQGGFGSVYRGKLQSSDSSSSSPITWVAVKQLAQGSHQGQREFLAELTTISKIRHKNLVQLQGWCHERGQLLLVYDYMSNGSLDRLLDSGCSSSSSSSTTRSSDPHEQQLQVLSWDRRFHIVTGIVAALSYLHNEWQQCVLHRDVKPSNVMLDENFNAHLGDFGLARLIDHNKMAWTTMVAGTIGYMSPEFVHRGRATKQSDVYSFGALALEVACGRRPVDSSLAETEVVLLDCLWRAHERGELLCMMDPKLDGEFDVAQATCLLHVGLLCCHPDPDARPSMVLARQILSGDQPSPPLPAKRPHMIFDTMIQASEFTPLLSGSSSQTLNPKP